MSEPTFHRGGSGTPMVLLHGFTATRHTWTPILAGLQRHHDVLTPTLAGHFGGSDLPTGVEPTADALADVVERDMDEAGLDRAHLVGNSLGGWLALELAARGRGLSVIALAPAGGWEHESREARRIERLFRRTYRLLAVAGSRADLLASRPGLRAIALRDILARPRAVAPVAAAEMIRGAAECSIYRPFLEATARDGFHDLASIDCPVRIAWGTEDRILCWPRYAARLRVQVPQAEFVELHGLGHVPMWDDPELVTCTILETSARVDAQAGAPVASG